jgi:hypothetical protein
VLDIWAPPDAALATIVTAAGLGAWIGAVYVVGLPVAVLVGLKEPQSAAPQVTVQLTPPLLGSSLTNAAMLAVAPSAIDVGGDVVKPTEMGGLPDPPPPPQAVMASRTERAEAEAAVRTAVRTKVFMMCVEGVASDPNSSDSKPSRRWLTVSVFAFASRIQRAMSRPLG